MATFLRRAASRLIGVSIRSRSVIDFILDPSFIVHGCRRHPIPSFSRKILFTTSTKSASSDDPLLRIIEREIGFAEQTDDYNRVEEKQSGSPFKMEDKPGTQTVILTREYEGERVKVEVHMTNLVTGEKEEDEEEDNEEEENEDDEERPEKPKQSSVPLFVTLSKKTGPGLEFRCTAFPDKIVIKDMWVRFPDDPSKDEVAYEGPYFRDLDEKLRKAFHRYIEIREIKPSTINFLHEYMINKDSKEHLLWLKSLKNFVKS